MSGQISSAAGRHLGSLGKLTIAERVLVRRSMLGSVLAIAGIAVLVIAVALAFPEFGQAYVGVNQ